MGKWAGWTVIPRTMRADDRLPHDELVVAMMAGLVEQQGYHPTGPFELTWHEIDQRELDLEIAINGEAKFELGDWRVTCIIDVAEQEPRVREPIDRELFERTAPAWNCVAYPGEGMHYPARDGVCQWCGGATVSDDQGIVYLRLSDFRDDDPGTFDARRDELVALSAEVGFPSPRVIVENDVDGQGKLRGVSAHARPDRVRAAGLVTLRTRRPRYRQVMLDLQAEGGLLLVSDESRLTRDYRDGEDLLDACEVGGASVVALDDDGGARWVLTKGGTRAERSAFRDRVNDARRFSEDIGAKVRRGRRRWAGKSYQGGRRPFGYQVEPGTAEHRRNLVTDPAEAAALNAAEAALLDEGWSLAAVTRRLREEGPPTVTGAAWNTGTVRDMLMKPTVAGLALRGGELVEAPWEAIIDRPRWEAIIALLTDPARRTTTANEPRWLVSCFATCEVCGGQMKIGGGGQGRGPSYVGSECGHVRRNALKVDETVGLYVIAWLERYADTDRLRPAAPANGHAGRLRDELAGLHEERRALMAHFAGDPDALALIREKDRRMTAIDGQLKAIAVAVADPIADMRPEARAGATVRAVWEAAPMPRKRAIVQAVIRSVVIRRQGPGKRFDPDAIEVTYV